MSYVDSVLQELVRKNPAQEEFIQAATEVLNSLRPVIDANPRFEQTGLLERLTEPERVVMFRCLGWTIRAKFRLTAVSAYSSTVPSRLAQGRSAFPSFR